MKIEYKENRKDIISFEIINNSFFYLNSQMEIWKDASILTIIKSDFTGKLSTIGNLLIWQDFRGKAFIFDVDINKCVFEHYDISKEEYSILNINVCDSKCLILRKYILDTCQIFLFFPESNEMTLINFNIDYAFNKGKYLFTKNIDSIERITIEGEILWKYQLLSKEFNNTINQKCKVEISKLLGVYQNLVWCYSNSGELFGLDINSGDLISRIGYKELDNLSKLPFTINDNDYIPVRVQFDEKKGEVFGFQEYIYCIVDLKQKRPRRNYSDVIKIKEYNMEANFGNYPIDDKYIYFCDSRKGKIGILNRSTLEIEWTYELDIPQKGIVVVIDEMKINNNFWYIKDRYNTLHIFQKDID